MIEKYRGKESFPKGLSQKDINKTKNRLGCLILILIGLFLFVAYFPGFLAYRERGHLATAEHCARTIQKALAAYKENQANKGYPVEISDWHTFSELAAAKGLNFPGTLSEADIITFHYESIDGSEYKLILEIDLPENTSLERFLLVTPNEITQHKNKP